MSLNKARQRFGELWGGDEVGVGGDAGAGSDLDVVHQGNDWANTAIRINKTIYSATEPTIGLDAKT